MYKNTASPILPRNDSRRWRIDILDCGFIHASRTVGVRVPTCAREYVYICIENRR